MLTPELEKLKDSLTCVTYNGAQHTHILIQEADGLASLKKVTLDAKNGNWFSFSPDEGRGELGVLSPLLCTSAVYDHHRACDCVVVIADNKNLKVIYIDLKSGNPTGYAGQFKSTRQFMRYAVGLINEFFNETKLIIKKEHYVIFYGGLQGSIRKRPTVTKKVSTAPDSAHKVAILNESTYSLNKLLKELEF